MSAYEHWTLLYFHSHPFDLEGLVERVLQVERPDVIIEVRGGSSGHGDQGRDVVIKARRSDVDPLGVVQVSAQEDWRTKFRRELRSLIKRAQAGKATGAPDTWIFATVQPVHMKKSLRPGAKATDKDDELRWAKNTLTAAQLNTDVEIWGLQDFVSVIAGPKGANIRLEFGAPSCIDDSLESIFAAFDAFTGASLEGIANEIMGLGHLPRDELASLEDQLSQNNSVFLVGEGGSGKSALSAAIASSERSKGKAVLYIRANSFAATDGIADIEKRIAVSGALMTTLTRIAKIVPCVLVVDQLDTIAGTPLFLALVGLLTTAGRTSGVSVLAVSRSWQAEKEPELSRIRFQRLEMKPLDGQYLLGLLLQLGISRPTNILLELGANLLNLSLIAELSSLGQDLRSITGRLDLWNRYRLTVSQREGMSAVDLAVVLSKRSLLSSTNEFPIQPVERVEGDRLISRGLLRQSRGQTFTFRHQELEEYFYAWDASMVRQISAHQLRAEIGERRGRRVLVWLLQMYLQEMPELAAGLLKDVLLNDDWQFYTQADLLDVVSEVESPPNELAEIIVQATASPQLADYFYRRLALPAWLPILHSLGAFSHPPALKRVANGTQIVYWAEGEFLAKVAQANPVPVIAIAAEIRTDNPAVLQRLIQAAQNMRPTDAIGMVPFVVSWLDVDQHWFVPDAMLSLAETLLGAGQWRATVHLAEALLRYEVKGGSVFGDESVPFIDRYQFEETVRRLVPKMSEQRPWQTVQLLDSLLRNSIAAEIKSGHHEYSAWRSAIEDNPQNSKATHYKDDILVVLRDSVNRLFSVDPRRGAQYAERQLNSRLAILRRLGIYLLTVNLKPLGLLPGTYLQSPQIYWDTEAYHEVWKLLEIAFRSLDKTTRAKVIAAIQAEPPIRVLRRLEGSTRDEVIKRHKARFLWPIRKMLPISLRRQAEEAFSSEASLKHLDFLHWHSEGMWGPTFPSEEHGLEDMTPADFEAFERSWTPSDGFMEPGEEELAGALEGVAAKNFATYSSDFGRFTSERLRGTYCYHVLRGLTQAVKENNHLDYAPVLSGCEYLIQLDASRFPTGPKGYGYNPAWTIGGVAEFLNEALRRDEFAPDPSLSDRLLFLLDRTISRALESIDQEGVSGDVDFLTIAINNPAGKALEALLMFALWRARELSRHDSTIGPKLEPRVKGLIQQFIEPGQYSWPPGHAVLGQWLRYLTWLDQSWVRDSWKKLFPDQGEYRPYWKAALSGAVLYGGGFLRDLYPLFRDEFRRALLEEEWRESRLSEAVGHVGSYVACAYWLGLEPLESSDSLVRDVFESDSLEARRSFLWTLGHDLRDVKPAKDDIIWQRLRNIWSWRMMQVEPNEEATASEAANFCWWLEGVPEELDECVELVNATIDKLKEEMHARDVLEFLASRSPRNPEESVEALGHLVRRRMAGYALSAETSSIRTILQSALRSTVRAQELAIDVINTFGRNADHRFRDLLA